MFILFTVCLSTLDMDLNLQSVVVLTDKLTDLYDYVTASVQSVGFAHTVYPSGKNRNVMLLRIPWFSTRGLVL